MERTKQCGRSSALLAMLLAASVAACGGSRVELGPDLPVEPGPDFEPGPDVDALPDAEAVPDAPGQDEPPAPGDALGDDGGVPGCEPGAEPLCRVGMQPVACDAVVPTVLDQLPGAGPRQRCEAACSIPGTTALDGRDGCAQRVSCWACATLVRLPCDACCRLSDEPPSATPCDDDPCTRDTCDLAGCRHDPLDWIGEPCERTGFFGTCAGTLACGPEGDEECGAPEPQVEVPNGLDDDCDGKIDELCAWEADVPIPYVQDFQDAGNKAPDPQAACFTVVTAEGPAGAGWSLSDAPVIGAYHLRLEGGGAAGPLDTIAHTPRIDCSLSDPGLPNGDFYNTTKSTTVQWRMAYRHAAGGGPVGLAVLATGDDFATAETLWSATVAGDVPFDLLSARLPEALWTSKTLRIGFRATGDASAIAAWEVDRIVVAAGVPNEYASTQVLKCDPSKSQCEMPTEYEKVCDTDPWGSDPLPECEDDGDGCLDLRLGACEWYKLMMCFKDPDATTSTWNFFGYPGGWMEGSPYDPAPFVFGKGGCSKSLGGFCPTGAGTFLCAFEIKPACQEGYAGHYRVGLAVRDEFDPAKAAHQPFESLTCLDLVVGSPP